MGATEPSPNPEGVRHPAVQVPPAGAVGDEPQRAVGRPGGLRHRLAGSGAGEGRGARTTAGCCSPGPMLDQRRSLTTSSVPSHGMSGWSHWSQHSRPPSGDRRGSETKSGPLTRRPGRQLAGRVDHDDLVDDLGRPRAGGVVLADDEQPPAGRRRAAVGPAVARGHLRLGGQRRRRGRVGEAVTGTGTAAGRPSRRRQTARVAHPPGAAAVLVDRRSARWRPAGRSVDRPAPAGRHRTSWMRPPSAGRRLDHQTSSPSTATPPSAGRRLHHQLGGDRRRPRPVRLPGIGLGRRGLGLGGCGLVRPRLRPDGPGLDGRGVVHRYCASPSRSAMRVTPSPRSSSPRANDRRA